ncbi:MAG: ATP synthase F1 subunit gamma [Bacteroides sp.]|nr:ATP synthase F1 subunit gamma [Bacteroides sp.]MDE6423721.1 ATP synthase F1 subunit gamma [Muribaculaceae bacterium]
MATLKALKTRIGSVASSEKITGAMKMISSAKVHKNEQELKKLLPFKDQVKSIMGHLLDTDIDFNSPLINEREVKRVGVVIYGTDDGLCGAYNMNIFKRFLIEKAHIRENFGEDVEITLIPVGKKVAKACLKLRERNLRAMVIPGVDSKMDAKTVNDFTHSLRNDFESGIYDRVEVIYMKFISMGKQVPTVDQLYPVSRESIEAEGKGSEDNKMYIFEPDPNSIFNEVLPMFVLSTMQEITIENRASEQAARVMAMQAANDNAKKLLESLQLEYNKLRQQGITTELLDILGGQIGR